MTVVDGQMLNGRMVVVLARAEHTSGETPPQAQPDAGVTSDAAAAPGAGGSADAAKSAKSAKDDATKTAKDSAAASGKASGLSPGKPKLGPTQAAAAKKKAKLQAAATQAKALELASRDGVALAEDCSKP